MTLAHGIDDGGNVLDVACIVAPCALHAGRQVGRRFHDRDAGACLGERLAYAQEGHGRAAEFRRAALRPDEVQPFAVGRIQQHEACVGRDVGQCPHRHRRAVFRGAALHFQQLGRRLRGQAAGQRARQQDGSVQANRIVQKASHLYRLSPLRMR